MTEERRQYRILLRNNSFRFLDNDLLPRGGDMIETFTQIMAILAAFGVATSTLLMYKYAFGLVHGARVPVEIIVWPDKQFLIAISMLVTGFGCVVAWNGFFPDRRDLMILGSLPVRMRTFFAAKAVSIGIFLVLLVVSTNAFTFVIFPICMLANETGAPFLPFYALIHIVAVFAACAFVMFFLLAVEGILISLLRYSAFQRVSSYVQATALLLLLAFFVVPAPATPALLAHARWAPPFWFVGLYQEMLGSTHPGILELAGIAKAALAGSALLAVLAYTAGYWKMTRKVLEEPELAPGAHSHRRLCPAWLMRLLFPTPLQTALFHFIRRTLARDRKSRVVLTAYVSLGLGYFVGDFAGMLRGGFSRWSTPTPAMAGFSLVLLFAILIGMRVLFGLPVDLRANWVFRLTETASTAEYRAAVRRTMLVLGALPIWIASAPLYAALWGWRLATMHLMVLVLVSLLIVEQSTRKFGKVPFTCAMMPGQSNLKAKVPSYIVLFAALVSLLTQVEVATLKRPGSFWWPFGFGCLWLGWMVWSRRRSEREVPRLVYEDRPMEITQLRLAD